MLPGPTHERVRPVSAERPVPYSQMRPGHADRDKVVDRLQEAFADGRLADDEYEERLQRALSAKTFGELSALTRDIPGDRVIQPMSGRFPVPMGRRPDMRPFASAALGGAGFVLVLGPLAWIPALVLGHQALRSLPKNDDRRHLAVIGVALGWAGIALTMLAIFLFIAIAVASSGGA
jgi:hypothetical protein